MLCGGDICMLYLTVAYIISVLQIGPCKHLHFMDIMEPKTKLAPYTNKSKHNFRPHDLYKLEMFMMKTNSVLKPVLHNSKSNT